MCNKLTCPGCRRPLERVRGGFNCSACHTHWKLGNLIIVIKESPDEDIRRVEIVNSDGSTQKVVVVIDFEFLDDHKEFLVYTDKTKDPYGNNKVFVSRIDRSKHGFVELLGVSDDDWERVEMVLAYLSDTGEELEIV